MALNQDALDELRSLDPDGSAGLLAQIINSYFNDAPALITQINVALAAHDAEGLTRHAHSLKSTSMSLGATRLGEMSRDIEMDGKNNALAGVSAKLDALKAEYALTEQWLRAEIAAPKT